MSSKHTGRRKWTAFTKIPMFITFLPREAAVTSVKTKSVIETWPLTGLRNQSYDSASKWDGGDPRRDSKATFLVAPWTTHAVAWPRQPSWGERRDHRFQLLPTEHNLEFQFGQVICLLKAQMNCFGLGFMFTTKMSLKKQLLCWYLRLMQYVGARMFLLDRSKACVNGQC